MHIIIGVALRWAAVCGVGTIGMLSFAEMQPRQTERSACVLSFTPSIFCISPPATRPLSARRAQSSAAADRHRYLGMQFNGHEIRDGELIRQHACKLVSEGIVSKTAMRPMRLQSALWRKTNASTGRNSSSSA